MFKKTTLSQPTCLPRADTVSVGAPPGLETTLLKPTSSIPSFSGLCFSSDVRLGVRLAGGSEKDILAAPILNNA
jgi:hypothetical protein